jgi:hypothetical protein
MNKTLDAMKKGDLIEFDSDLQVESGPCAGVVLDVTERSVNSSYGDKLSRFFKKDLKLKRVTTAAKSGKTLWIFE